MCLSESSPAYWPQTKVISLVKSSLVLVFIMFLGLETVVVFSSPVQVHQRNKVLVNHCDFIPHQFSFTNLIECIKDTINDGIIVKRDAESTDENENLFELPDYYQTHIPTESTKSIFNLNIFNALSLISRYDDAKCIPRIICEVATGVIPESSEYKQSYTNIPINSILSFLLSLTTGETSSPFLLFGKSALMGYSNKGNPEICYHQYPKCPRDPSDLVNYLNNYNGGFFRFFNNNNSKFHYQKANSNNNNEFSTFQQASNLPVDPITDRKATGELKFDVPMSMPRSSQFLLNERNVNNKIVFPDNLRRIDGIATSDNNNSNKDTKNTGILSEIHPFFPQDRKGRKIPEVVYDLYDYNNNNNNNNNNNINGNKQPILDGESIMIKIDNEKLYSNHFKRTLKKGLVNDDVLQPIDLEGLNVINLVELYGEDVTQLKEQVFHPCDMICHDSRGTSVQFHQILNLDGSLSTFMTPEQPILDLSQSLTCQIMCYNEHGERKEIFTTLSRTLRANFNRKERNSQEYSSTNESLRVKVIKPRFVGDSIVDEKTMNPPLTLSNTNSMFMPGMPPIRLTGGQSDILTGIQPFGQGSTVVGGQQGAIPFMGGQLGQQEDTPVGDNPLAIFTNQSVSLAHPNYGGLSGGFPQSTGLPASFTMCGNYLYIVPLNAIATPVCTVPIHPPMIEQKPLLSTEKNPWGNYTNFFNKLANDSNNNYRSNSGLSNNNNDFMRQVNSSYQNTFYHQVTSPKYDGISTTTNVGAGSAMFTPAVLDVAVVNPGDYPQGSCLEGESWNSDDIRQCVPITNHQDTDYDYRNIQVGQTFNKVPVGSRQSDPEKIIIKTPSANMYIQSNY